MSLTEPITNPDTTNTDLEYWNKVLNSHGLSMERASRPRVQLGSREERKAGKARKVQRIISVGTSNDVVRVEAALHEDHITHIKNGRRIGSGRTVRPHGFGPDDAETDNGRS